MSNHHPNAVLSRLQSLIPTPIQASIDVDDILALHERHAMDAMTHTRLGGPPLPVFGVPLRQVLMYAAAADSNPPVPLVAHACVCELAQRQFQNTSSHPLTSSPPPTPAARTALLRLTHAFDCPPYAPPPSQLSNCTTQELAVLLKVFVLALPEPVLIPAIAEGVWRWCVRPAAEEKNDDDARRVDIASTLLQLLPSPNLALLALLLSFFANQVDARHYDALARVYGAALFGFTKLHSRSAGSRLPTPDARATRTAMWFLQRWTRIEPSLPSPFRFLTRRRFAPPLPSSTSHTGSQTRLPRPRSGLPSRIQPPNSPYFRQRSTSLAVPPTSHRHLKAVPASGSQRRLSVSFETPEKHGHLRQDASKRQRYRAASMVIPPGVVDLGLDPSPLAHQNTRARTRPVSWIGSGRAPTEDGERDEEVLLPGGSTRVTVSRRVTASVPALGGHYEENEAIVIAPDVDLNLDANPTPHATLSTSGDIPRHALEAAGMECIHDEPDPCGRSRSGGDDGDGERVEGGHVALAREISSCSTPARAFTHWPLSLKPPTNTRLDLYPTVDERLLDVTLPPLPPLEFELGLTSGDELSMAPSPLIENFDVATPLARPDPFLPLSSSSPGLQNMLGDSDQALRRSPTAQLAYARSLSSALHDSEDAEDAEVVVEAGRQLWGSTAGDEVQEGDVDGAEPEGDGSSLPEPRMNGLATPHLERDVESSALRTSDDVNALPTSPSIQPAPLQVSQSTSRSPALPQSPSPSSSPSPPPSGRTSPMHLSPLPSPWSPLASPSSEQAKPVGPQQPSHLELNTSTRGSGMPMSNSWPHSVEAPDTLVPRPSYSSVPINIALPDSTGFSSTTRSPIPFLESGAPAREGAAAGIRMHVRTDVDAWAECARLRAELEVARRERDEAREVVREMREVVGLRGGVGEGRT
ncbi:hypothetical protein HGRIS_001634 [Hohenbuehelia grisea]|uniref:Rho-GAP domain-containing protein n=1 Tax=Hohenbuehelia grisea TaxID=104357 RepID=A0ABR3JIP1_9AGAR